MSEGRCCGRMANHGRSAPSRTSARPRGTHGTRSSAPVPRAPGRRAGRGPAPEHPARTDRCPSSGSPSSSDAMFRALRPDPRGGPGAALPLPAHPRSVPGAPIPPAVATDTGDRARGTLPHHASRSASAALGARASRAVCPAPGRGGHLSVGGGRHTARRADRAHRRVGGRPGVGTGSWRRQLPVRLVDPARLAGRRLSQLGVDGSDGRRLRVLRDPDATAADGRGDEMDADSHSWVPLEDREPSLRGRASIPGRSRRSVAQPTRLRFGRDRDLHVFTCPADPGHPPRWVLA